jgi:hypothetical protein
MHITRLRIPLARDGLLAAAMGLATTAASAGPTMGSAASPPEATIAFAAHDGIEDWEEDGSKGLWIKARGRHWYYARFFAPCSGLQFHEALRFKFGPAGELDRWSEVYTRDSGRCTFTSLVASDGPPPKAKAARPIAAPAAPATPTVPAPTAPAPPAPAPGG